MSYGLFLRTATFSPNWNICPRSPLYKQEINWSAGTRRKLERRRFFRVHPNIIKRIKRLLRLETLSRQTAERVILPGSPVPGWIFWRCSYFRAFPTPCKGPFAHPPVSTHRSTKLNTDTAVTLWTLVWGEWTCLLLPPQSVYNRRKSLRFVWKGGFGISITADNEILLKYG